MAGDELVATSHYANRRRLEQALLPDALREGADPALVIPFHLVRAVLKFVEREVQHANDLQRRRRFSSRLLLTSGRGGRERLDGHGAGGLQRFSTPRNPSRRCGRLDPDPLQNLRAVLLLCCARSEWRQQRCSLSVLRLRPSG